MVDILIRNVPEDVAAVIDAKAQRAGLSRNEYLRRAVACEGRPDAGEVAVRSLQLLAERFIDLNDPDMMGRAWS